jgi:hypothetical protein
LPASVFSGVAALRMKSAVCAASASLLWTSAGASEPSTAVEVQLELRAGPECASEAALKRRILVRSERVRFVDLESPRTRRVRASLEPGREGAVIARLSVQRPSGGAAERVLRAGSCADALEALALVAAVTLDPLARTDADAELARSSEAERDVHTRPDAETPPARPAVAPEPPRDEVIGGEREALTAAARFESGLVPSVGLVGAAVWGPAPGGLPGAGLYFDLMALDPRPDGAPAIGSPSARATLVRVARGGFDAEYGTAAFTLTALALELCPIALGAGAFVLRPCPTLSVGFLSASGSRTEAGRSDVRPWWVVGLAALGTARLSDRVELVAGGAAGRPLVRDRFQFHPAVFHEVPELAFSANAGLGLRFP